MRRYRVRFCTAVYNPSGFSWVFCTDQRLSVHVALQPTFIYVEAVTSRINPLFLTTSAVSSSFPFCKLHNLSFEVWETLPRQQGFFLPLIQQSFFWLFCVLIIHSIAFGCSYKKVFLVRRRLHHMDEIRYIKHEMFQYSSQYSFSMVWGWARGHFGTLCLQPISLHTTIF